MIKTAIKVEKGVVEKLRKIRDKMNKDMSDMSFEEVKKYLKKMQEKKINS